jgi:hypothetical protein
MTGVTGFCPTYVLLGVSTNRAGASVGALRRRRDLHSCAASRQLLTPARWLAGASLRDSQRAIAGSR